MRLEARKYLFDIQQAADSIAAFCAGKNFDQYRADEAAPALGDTAPVRSPAQHDQQSPARA